MTKPTSRRGVVSASARTGSVEGSSADAKSGAPVPNKYIRLPLTALSQILMIV